MKRSILFKYLLMLLPLWGIFTACTLTREPADPEIKSVQISRFALSAKTVPELAQTVFSIDHRKGLIYNAKPLKRGTVLDSVAITALTLEYAIIDVKVGGVVVPKSEKDSVYLRNHTDGVQIVVNSEDKTRSKSYELKINIYEHDPLALAWRQTGIAPDYTEYAATGVASGLIPGDQEVYYYYSKEGVTHIYEPQAPDYWVKFVERTIDLQSVARLTDNLLLVQPREGETYFLNPRNGAYFPAGFTVDKIIGAYPLAHDTKQWEVAVLVKESDGLHFGRVTAPDGAPVLAVGERIPDAFPVTDFCTFLTPVENRSVLYVMGGYDQNGSAHPYVWSTTTATDWLTPHNTGVQSGLPEGLAQGAAVYDPEKNVILYFATQAAQGQTGKLSVYTSADKGTTWLQADGKELIPAELQNTSVGKGLVIFKDPQAGFILFGGGTTAQGTGVWVGKYKTA